MPIEQIMFLHNNLRSSMKPHSILLSAAVSLLFLMGCDPAKDSGSSDAPAPPAPVEPGDGTASVLAPSAPGIPAAPGAPAAPVEPAAIVPVEPPDAGTEKVLASLNVAAEYYNRAIVTMVAEDEEQAKNWKQPPALTDLQQLVAYKVIRAVPPAPAGRKFIYDPKDGKVKLQ